MLISSARSAIRLRGVRHNNLKNFDLDLPLNRLIVLTGLSGSGKSSLAFDTLFAEGQRRYIETFSPYARQFLDRMDKPQVDSIEGIPPAVAIEQQNSVKSTRSTVGTMTEICDFMKVLWPHLALLHCRGCGRVVEKDPAQKVWQQTLAAHSGQEVLITFDLPRSEKLSLAESFQLITKQGYQRLLWNGHVARIEEAEQTATTATSLPSVFTVVQDRLRVNAPQRARFIEACEQAYHFGKGKLAIRVLSGPDQLRDPERYSQRLHCARCDLQYAEPTPALFSFNHPVGACPECRGFGRIISIDYDLAVPDRSRTLAEGVVKPWLTGQGAECQTDLMRTCRKMDVPTNIPFERLPEKYQKLVIEGEPGYGTDEERQWPRAWYGVKGYFRWLESRAYKMHVRVLLSRYRAYTPCPRCNGARFQPESLLYRAPVPGNLDIPYLKTRRDLPEAFAGSLTLSDFYELPIRDASRFIANVVTKHAPAANDPVRLTMDEVRARLGYLEQVGLGYLTLNRPTRSLSGGETERVNLTTCLGTRLVNTLFVLDEPSVGLHPRDTERLVRILERLRDAGNTVVVVEHEASIMRAADQLVDLGPGHGATGGELVFQGSYEEMLRCERSLTGQYLAGIRSIEVPGRAGSGSERRGIAGSGKDRATASLTPSAAALHDTTLPYGDQASIAPTLQLGGVSLHNLRNFEITIPLGRLVCVTGVSGSGKSTLIREALFPLLAARLRSAAAEVKASDRLSTTEPATDEDDEAEPGEATASRGTLTGAEHLDRVVFVDQSILGKTPRSNPAVYTGAFDFIRELFAQSEIAQQRGLNASAFSFNSAQGQCERCRGAGFEKIEMQFLSDVFIRCPDCEGRRYRPHILEIKIAPGLLAPSKRNGKLAPPPPLINLGVTPLSIADVLDATVDEAVDFLAHFGDVSAAKQARASLRLLREVGLGYLKLGQPINTLSGGESQRLKLVRELAEDATTTVAAGHRSSRQRPAGGTLFLFDEPTTGLHFDDIRVLLQVFQRLVEAGNSVLIIEHNLEVIKCADWVIDLGPEAGDLGGLLVGEGTPEHLSTVAESHTGQALREVLRPSPVRTTSTSSPLSPPSPNRPDKTTLPNRKIRDGVVLTTVGTTSTSSPLSPPSPNRPDKKTLPNRKIRDGVDPVPTGLDVHPPQVGTTSTSSPLSSPSPNRPDKTTLPNRKTRDGVEPVPTGLDVHPTQVRTTSTSSPLSSSSPTRRKARRS
jgi:excinuclease ABC subunit A